MAEKTKMDDTEIGGGLGDVVRRVAELAERGAQPTVIKVETKDLGLGPGLPDAVPFIWDAQSNTPRELAPAIERARVTPARRTGVAVATTLESFIALVERHKDMGQSVVFANTEFPGAGLRAVFDYHALDHDAEPAHLDHGARYAFEIDAGAAGWMAGQADPYDQRDFAELIEDRVADLVVPGEAELAIAAMFQTTVATPPEMIRLSRGLMVHVEGKASATVSLASGEGEIMYSEEHRGEDGGKVTVPGLFVIALPLFKGGDVVRVPVKLRYRVRGGAVKWSYALYRVDDLLRQRVRDDLARVAAETALPCFEGAPERGGAAAAPGAS